MQPKNKGENKWVIGEEKKIQFIQSKLLLENNFKHAFFTRHCSRKKPELILKYLGLKASVHKQNQVHSGKVLACSNHLSEGSSKSDSIISKKKDQSLWVYSSDCIPILIADRDTGKTAACHSGWRGLVKNIIHNTINEFEDQGSKRKNLIFSLGPAISALNYEVGVDVLHQVLNSIKRNEDVENIVKIQDKKFFIKTINANKFLLDIRMVAFNQLLTEEIKPNQISVCEFCTFSNPELFSSWRRDHKKGYQWSMIISK